jgi:hypothetical protein
MLKICFRVCIAPPTLEKWAKDVGGAREATRYFLC